MEPYKVLLADDEEDIRVGISQKMDWAELGFTLVGEADNGQDALELAESLLPDVVPEHTLLVRWCVCCCSVPSLLCCWQVLPQPLSLNRLLPWAQQLVPPCVCGQMPPPLLL